MSRKQQTLSAVLILMILGSLLHFKYINEFPSHTHAWTQSDRYAISLGFVNNNLNFFKPETMLLNQEHPDNSITSVDFPIHDYIPAVFMKITGSTSPWIFRLYVLLYSLVGLLFLYKLSFKLTKSYLKSLLVMIFAATSPVFVYYQGGFLPSVPSLANAIIGIYFYYVYVCENRNSRFYIAVLFLSLAALSRTTFTIFLLSVFAFELLRIIMKEAKLLNKILPVLLSCLAILGYFLYNNWLRDNYGTIFLHKLLPATSFQEAKEILSTVFEVWKFKYISKFHYLIFLIVLLAWLYSLWKKKRDDNIEHRNSYEISRMTMLLIIVIVACIAFALLMFKQYPAHDYYFLDTFFLPLLLLLILLLASLPEIKGNRYKSIAIILLVLFTVSTALNAYFFQEKRRETGSWDRIATTIENYRDSKLFLYENAVTDESRILAIDTYAPNIPFIFMEKKGYGLMSTKSHRIEEAFTWDFDYITIQNDLFVSDIYSNYPEIITRIEKIADNGNISLCILSEDTVTQSLFAFLGIDDQDPSFQASISFDTIADTAWENTKSISDTTYSGINAGVVEQEDVYGLSYKSKDLPVLTDKSRLLVLSSYFFCDTVPDCNIVALINEDGKNSYYQTFNLKELISKDGGWEKVDLTFSLPKVRSQDYEFALFLWNTGKVKLLVDDFSFMMY